MSMNGLRAAYVNSSAPYRSWLRTSELNSLTICFGSMSSVNQSSSISMLQAALHFLSMYTGCLSRNPSRLRHKVFYFVYLFQRGPTQVYLLFHHIGTHCTAKHLIFERVPAHPVFLSPYVACTQHRLQAWYIVCHPHNIFCNQPCRLDISSGLSLCPKCVPYRLW